jgi:hypothetical protein
MSRGIGTIAVNSLSLTVSHNPFVLDSLDGKMEICEGVYDVSGTNSAILRRDATFNYIKELIPRSPETREIKKMHDEIIISDDVQSYKLKIFAPYTAKITGSVGDFVRAEIGFIAQVAEPNTSYVTNAENRTESPLIFYNTKIEHDDVNIDCTKFEIEILREVNKENYFIGSSCLQTKQMKDEVYAQIGATSIKGSLSISNKEYKIIDDMIKYSGNVKPSKSKPCHHITKRSRIKIQMGTTIVDLGGVMLYNMSSTGQGRQRFEKSVNFTCQITEATTQISIDGVVPT